MATFADTLYLWRAERGLTQEALAQATGIPRPNLSALERGALEPTLRTLRRLAVALDIRPGWLADGIPPGSEDRKALDRYRMDQIVSVVMDRGRLKNPYEQRVARLLKAQVSHRFPSRRPSPRKGVRETRRTWALLRNLVSPEELNTLLGRLEERLGERG